MIRSIAIKERSVRARKKLLHEGRSLIYIYTLSETTVNL